jgi:hypothetical protein
MTTTTECRADPWGYTQFASDPSAPQPDHQFEMKFEKIPGNRKDFNH